MNDSVEITPELVIEWGLNVAEYTDLEKTAKALYSVYTAQRSKQRPEEHRMARSMRKKYKKKRLY